MSDSAKKPFGLKSGVGLVIANMIGAGVFVSAGYMAWGMNPLTILAAWVVGMLLAMCGARAYAEVARLVPRSGGEYRYLTELIHPFAGYLAGWTSLLAGFSAPIAIDAIAAGAYANQVFPQVPATAIACGTIVVLTLAHAFHLKTSATVQNLLVVVKVLLVLGFIAVGVMYGTTEWPTWQAIKPSEEPVSNFAGSLFFIAFAFSGWNAAIYASEEFENPTRDVPRAMLIGCFLVGLLYLALNYVFVANLDATQLASIDEGHHVILGHVVMEKLRGPVAARIFSGVMVLLFISAMSAMMLVGPRVYAAMAADGVLPKGLKAKDGRPPLMGVLLQGWIALILIFTHDLKEVLSSIGAVLTLLAALTAIGLFRARTEATSLVARVCAGVYALAAMWMLYFGFQRDPKLFIWVGLLLVVTSGAWVWTRRRNRSAA